MIHTTPCPPGPNYHDYQDYDDRAQVSDSKTRAQTTPTLLLTVMGVQPPFIYDKPSSYTFGGPTSRAFNPRAVTHASWTPRAPKVKQDGPLINFNRHPDTVSYTDRHQHSHPLTMPSTISHRTAISVQRQCIPTPGLE